MPSVALVGVDSAGGVITGPGASKLTIDGIKASLLGDTVSSHGDSPHRNARMVQGSGKLRVGGIPVVLQGHSASCGHTASGSSKMSCSS